MHSFQECYVFLKCLFSHLSLFYSLCCTRERQCGHSLNNGLSSCLQPLNREPLIYHLDSTSRHTEDSEDLPDEFFEVTVDDVRKRFAKLKSERFVVGRGRKFVLSIQLKCLVATETHLSLTWGPAHSETDNQSVLRAVLLSFVNMYNL